MLVFVCADVRGKESSRECLTTSIANPDLQLKEETK